MNTAYEVTFDEYMISTDISKLDLQCIHQFLSEESYWAKDITPELVKRSVEYSLNFGAGTFRSLHSRIIFSMPLPQVSIKPRL